ncbi:outer membrane lipoprotein-sorting protein [Acidobacteriota bacterium]
MVFKKRCLRIVILLSVCLISGLAVTQNGEAQAATTSGKDLTANDIIKKADDKRAPSQPFKFDLVVEEYATNKETGKPERKSSSGFRVFVKGVVDKKYQSLCQFTSPLEDEGKVMLLDGNVFWLYIPGTRNVMRISAAQRLAGQASSADIASVNFQHDYDGAILGEEKAQDKDCYVLDLTAKNESVAYARLKYWVEKETFRPVKTEFYVASGRLLKTAYYTKFQECLGKNRCTLTVIVDGVNKSKKTTMQSSNWKLKELPGFWFRKSYLKNIQFEDD